MSTTDTATKGSVANLLAAATPSAADYIKVLKGERENWETGLLANSNEGLYQLLAKCLKLYELMIQNNDDGVRLCAQLATYLKNAKLKFSAETHTVVKIARAVFDTDSKRASALGTVLRAALEANIDHVGLADHIRDKGGIEKMRLAKSATSRDSTETKALNVWTALKDTALGVAAGAALKQQTDLAKVNSRVVLLATQQHNGEFLVHAVLRAESPVNSAFAAYKAANVAANNNNVDTAIVEEQNAKEELRKQAAAAALTA